MGCYSLKGTTQAANQYLQTLWQPEAQQLMADRYLRPADAQVLAANQHKLPPLTTFDPVAVFGDWDAIMQRYFTEGAKFDQLAR